MYKILNEMLQVPSFLLHTTYNLITVIVTVRLAVDKFSVINSRSGQIWNKLAVCGIVIKKSRLIAIRKDTNLEILSSLLWGSGHAPIIFKCKRFQPIAKSSSTIKNILK